MSFWSIFERKTGVDGRGMSGRVLLGKIDMLRILVPDQSHDLDLLSLLAGVINQSCELHLIAWSTALLKVT